MAIHKFDYILRTLFFKCSRFLANFSKVKRTYSLLLLEVEVAIFNQYGDY